MSNVVRPAFVISVPASDGERFAIIRPEAMIAGMFPLKPAEGMFEAMKRFISSAPLLTESELRAELTSIGLTDEAVTAQIQRARRQRKFNEGTSWEQITTIGFRNREGQEVVRKTGREGTTLDQRVFVLRCSVCGHEYDCDGCDIYDRLCPSCQDVSG
ncbi:MAG TPA: hypothetical protein VI485_22535 [Vicinamibacterales bacterium]|nr:hypothetical protein [Vicinamibacterales bacterium]